jgi:hypothetical protein
VDLTRRAETATPRDYPLLDRHIGNLLAALQWAETNEPLVLANLVEAATQFLQLRGRFELLGRYLPLAASAAEKAGNKGQQANTSMLLGNLEGRLGNLDPARGHYDAALLLYRAERARLGEANTLKSLGDLEGRLGNLDAARGHYDAALPLYRAERDRLGEANTLMSVADLFLGQQDWIQARAYYEQALPLFVAERDPLGQANTLIDLGRVRFALGEQAQGIRDVQNAAHLFRSMHDEAWANRAEQHLAAMQAALANPSTDNTAMPDPGLLDAFIRVDSSQAMVTLVQEHAELLSAEWISAIEALAAAQTDDGARRYLDARLATLKQIKHLAEQEASTRDELLDAFIKVESSEAMLKLVQEHAELLSAEWIATIEALVAAQAADGARG